jgi:hypothetical protein
VISLITTVLGELLGGALPLWLRGHAWAMLPLPPAFAWVLAAQPLARSYQITLLFAGVIAAPGFIPLFLMSNDHPKQIRAETQQAWQAMLSPRNLLIKLHDIVKRGRTFMTRQDATDATSMVYRQHLRTLLLNPLAIMIGANILIGLGAGLLLPYFSLFFVKHLGATSALFGVIDGTANALNAVATLLAPWIAMRIGRVATILLPRLLAIPIMLCIGLSTVLPLAAILYPLRQSLTDMPNGVLQVFSMEVVPPEHRGLANSSYQTANQVALAVATPIGGLLISRVGYTPVFFLTAVFYLLALALIWWRFGGKYVFEKPRATGDAKIHYTEESDYLPKF